MAKKPIATHHQNTEDAAATVHCTLCAEQATVQTKDNIPLCGIPGNHPEYDHEELFPINEIP